MPEKTQGLEDAVQTVSDRAASPSSAGSLGSQVVSFRLANEEYGLDIMKVREIILMGEITQVPEVPEYVCGLINLRGKVIPIVDLRRRFGLDIGDATEHTRIMVVNTNETTFGIIVDAVNEVLRIDAGEVSPPPTGLLGTDQSYIRGLVKMSERIMILLNLDMVLSQADQATMVECAGALG
ncbi:MAG: chemotaxis protein CheW [Phycisphaerae bacterium]